MKKTILAAFIAGVVACSAAPVNVLAADRTVSDAKTETTVNGEENGTADQAETADPAAMDDNSADTADATDSNGADTAGKDEQSSDKKSESDEGISKFSDVGKDSYAYEPIEWAVKNGVTQGTSDTTFSPNADCKRGEIVSFLYRAADGSPEKNARTFEDVSADDYYHDAVSWAVTYGITSGTSDTLFSPGKNCTRAEAVTFLWRMSRKPKASTASSFTDVEKGSYYEQAVNWAVENGIAKGVGDGRFNPNGVCKRGQIVSFIYRYYNPS